MNDFLQILISVLTTIPIAYTLFIWFGKKLIEKKFKESFEKLKHEHDKEMENVRFQISATYSRISKIHEKEFEVLPNLWNKLQTALGDVSDSVSIIQSYIDVNSLNEEELNELFSQLKFKKYQIEKIKNSYDKLDTYKNYFNEYKFNKANNSLNDFHDYLVYNKIFLNDNLFDLFSEIDMILYDTFLIYRNEGDRNDIYKNYKTIRDKALQLRDKIEKEIQRKLRFLEA